MIAYSKFCGVVPGIALPEQDQGSSAGRLIEWAGRCCYGSYGRGRDSAAFHQNILTVAHGSVLEHASLTFFITGVSRNLTHELVRHRAGMAFSMKSTRYCNEGDTEIAWHPLIPLLCSDDQKYHWHSVRQGAQSLYHDIVSTLEAELIAQGTDAITARKQARGAARGILPSALSTEITVTFNVRALRHFLEMRASAAADAEIRLMANRLYEAAQPYCPEYLADYERSEAPDGIGYCLTTPHRKV